MQRKGASTQSKLSDFVQGLLVLADNFEKLGSPSGKLFSIVCHGQIEILKLVNYFNTVFEPLGKNIVLWSFIIFQAINLIYNLGELVLVILI